MEKEVKTIGEEVTKAVETMKETGKAGKADRCTRQR